MSSGCVYTHPLCRCGAQIANIDIRGLDDITYRRGLSALLVLLRRANAGAQTGGMSDENDSPRFLYVR